MQQSTENLETLHHIMQNITDNISTVSPIMCCITPIHKSTYTRWKDKGLSQEKQVFRKKSQWVMQVAKDGWHLLLWQHIKMMLVVDLLEWDDGQTADRGQIGMQQTRHEVKVLRYQILTGLLIWNLCESYW